MPKQNISNIVSGAGLAASIWTVLDRAVRKHGGTDEDLHRLATPEGEEIIEKMADLIAKAGQSRPAVWSFVITLDSTKTVEKMVKAGGYDWKNSNINSRNFPVRPRASGVAEVFLLHFNRQLSSEQAIEEMDKLGYRPGELSELLAFGVKYPDEQRRDPIVALGSVWQDPGGGHRSVPGLWNGDYGRCLSLPWFEVDWDPGDRFLAVRK